MSAPFFDWVIVKLSQWLLKDDTVYRDDFYSDFNKICKDIQLGDVILTQGRNRISNIIRHITLSPWTHAALYVGNLQNVKNVKLREVAKRHCIDDPNRQWVIESIFGSGTLLADIKTYQNYHIRLLRPSKLTKDDAHKVVDFAIGRLGTQYDVRQILDLARLLLPWGIFPKKWRSSLFEHNALQPTKDICSSMIADAFQSVDYPILPLIEEGYENEMKFIRRNNRLYTPRDFDYSPYFDIIKYPFIPLIREGEYHHLPWMKNVISDDDYNNFNSLSPKIQKFFTSPAYAVIGASVNRDKFGNKVLRCYIQQNKKVYPVNPHEKVIEDIICVDKISNLPMNVKSISIVTPPVVTEKIVDQAVKKGIENIWMQPGSESAIAIQKCVNHKINVIADNSCILKELRFKE